MTTYELPNGIGYRPDAEDRVYRPPVAPEPFVAPKVTASAAKVDGSLIEQIHAAMVHARNEFAKHIDTTNKERHLYSQQGYREQVAAFASTAAARAVDAAVEQVKVCRDQAQTQLDKVRAGLTRPGDAAQESRNGRMWLRTKSVLEASKEPVVTAQDLVANASREELGVLLEELPAWCKANGHTLEWIEPTIRQHVPEYTDAQAKLQKATAAMLFTEQAANYLKKNFDSGTVPDPKMLGMLNPNTAGRLPIDRRGTLPDNNGGRYDPDAA